MVDLDISELESDDKEEITQFVESKLAVKTERNGDVITFENKTERTRVSVPEIKTYLKRYLHKNELRKQFRLLSEDGSLKFVKRPESDSEEDDEEDE
ncbi:MAG: hypothetical protein ACYC7D_07760 [Nitrososphaerales archaeon]